ncbi:MAG: XkdF-like putative serine protease domain-containing protein [Balneola sp.]
MPKDSKIKRYLSNVDVQFISLVDAAANRREFVYRSAEKFDPEFNAQINIQKVDEEKQLVYGIVYAPDEADTYGDAMTAETLEKAAHHFLTKARTSNVDTQHDNMPDDGVVVESFILGKNDSRFPGEKEGAWAVVIKVTDDETWEAVKSGDLKGISLAGKAQVEEVEDEDPDSLEKSIELIMSTISENLKKIFKSNGQKEEKLEKDFQTRVTAKEMRQAVWALEEEFSAILNDSEITDKKAAITTAVNQFSEYISKISFGETTTTKSKETMSTEETKKTEEGGAAEPDKEVETTKNENPTMEEKLDAFMKKTTESVDELAKKVESLEKAAPGRQSDEEVDEEEVEKSYDSKAPLGILG